MEMKDKSINRKSDQAHNIETVNASGKVYPEVEVKISPDISGEITELTVEEGDSVRKGPGACAHLRGYLCHPA
jgi:HlyD family secretion protein